MPAKIVPGQRFGSRIVLRRGMNKDHQIIWEMRCDCGWEGGVRQAPLLRGIGLTCLSCSGRLRTGALLRARKGLRVPRTLLAHFKAGAIARGLEFALTPDDIERLYDAQQGRCVLTGVALEFATRSSTQAASNLSIDRKDNTRGYTPDNVQLVTKAVNMARQALSVPDFVALCRAVAAHAAGDVEVADELAA